MRLSEYKGPNGKIDFERLAAVTAGWTDPSERAKRTEEALRAVYQDGRRWIPRRWIWRALNVAAYLRRCSPVDDGSDVAIGYADDLIKESPIDASKIVASWDRN